MTTPDLREAKLAEDVREACIEVLLRYNTATCSCLRCDEQRVMADRIRALDLAPLLPAARTEPTADAEIAGILCWAATDVRDLDQPAVRFYERDFYPLSNFSAFSVRWRRHTFATSEHAYHWAKFPQFTRDGETWVRDAIRTAPSAHEAFKMAERWKPLRLPDWEHIKVSVMRDILHAKAAQHEYVRRKLLQTGNRVLIEDSWRDDFWGWGPSRDGQNMLGKLWMEIRAGMRAAPTAGGTNADEQDGMGRVGAQIVPGNPSAKDRTPDGPPVSLAPSRPEAPYISSAMRRRIAQDVDAMHQHDEPSPPEAGHSVCPRCGWTVEKYGCSNPDCRYRGNGVPAASPREETTPETDNLYRFLVPEHDHFICYCKTLDLARSLERRLIAAERALKAMKL